uniref:Aminoglycoside phosphotransferase domain-containing protein n=1 Tax=Candidatus Kentrum sp. TUN TaxID=2126343 RepID=A0A450ZER5_9GAMM|nr:MAG: hypothetical protein BECKTUN1418F_GA0071002_100628 [Candidatus Kentron sp. TUN]VFK52479.1 MAG: hypothetical protein BECKTUN1418E_GA0071001_100827 [Candidatus Kentron sp. TUN]VFK56405.1 MAG: hypothetical protein BECKTUN1418D_GA0071000_104612 [Candidatus Kentron sp. TUN]
MDNRPDAIKTWLTGILPNERFELTAASQDASFRRYFRVSRANGESFIVMDAPPSHEDSRHFVHVAGLLRKAGVNVPETLATDFEQGFLLLSDLGTVRYLDILSDDRVERLYGDAMGALLAIQACAPCEQIPEYDAALLDEEMLLFRDWFIKRHLGIPITDTIDEILGDAFDFLEIIASEQPQVFVHRDYHSRNLMVQARHNPGILDFQDAVQGPITYDPVSLLKDVYISWPQTRVEAWALGYRDLAIQHGILVDDVDSETWLQWFDLMGVQRHLKIAGIFARLYHRDSKPGYLPNIPLTLDYLAFTCGQYPELADLGKLLDDLDVHRRTRDWNASLFPALEIQD